MKQLILTLSIILSSCSSYKDFVNQEISIKKEGKQAFSLNNNFMKIEATINNEKEYFHFDTGAKSSVIKDSIYLNKINKDKKELIKGISLTGANAVKIQSYDFVSNTVNCNLFNAKNKIFKFIKINNVSQTCTKTSENSVGIIGYDFIENSEYPILLNFETNTIEAIENISDFSNYVKSSIKIKKLGSKIIIPFNINGKTVDFLFDTGNSGGFKMKASDYNEVKQPEITIKALYNVASGLTEMRLKTYFENSILFENEKVKYKIMVNDNMHVNTIGIEFIKNYNWIFDFKKGFVYYKKSNNSITQNAFEVPKVNIQCISLNNKLLVGFISNFYQGNLNLNDQIISVNNQLVGPENICEMQTLLNSTQNWENLKLEVIPAKK